MRNRRVQEASMQVEGRIWRDEAVSAPSSRRRERCSAFHVADFVEEFFYVIEGEILLQLNNYANPTSPTGAMSGTTTWRLMYATVNAVDFDDSVFRVYVRLRDRPELVSEYDLVLVDEYQDFNRMEGGFISLLSQKSPIVIAGDETRHCIVNSGVRPGS
jgi:superfamily I DNA/RNA helicase